MIRKYLLVSWRNIFRYFSVSLMNIMGLAIGLACSMMIFLWVADELSYDRFHESIEHIYRVEEDQHYSNGIFHVTATPWPSGPVWKEKIPEIEHACRIAPAGSFLIKRNDLSFYEEKVAAVDSSFFDMFSFEIIAGHKSSVLSQPGSIVISTEMASKYFGKEDPVGQTLTINNSEVFQVSGVMQKMPSNSSIRYDFLVPFDYMKGSQWYSDHWGNNSIETYLQLYKNAGVAQVNTKLTEVVREHNPGSDTEFLLAPLIRMHLYSYWGYGHKPGAVLNVWIFSSIAILILIIACINFMNLSTARSASRAKEIGLRKVNGAHRSNLVFQFYGESMVMAGISMIIAWILVAILLHSFNLISGKDFHFADLLTPQYLIGMIAVVIFTGLLSGTYPAMVLSSFKPINTLKGSFSMGSKGKTFRSVTVTVQFALSIMLISGTLVIYNQLKHMQKQKLGYDKENLIYMQLRGDMKRSYPVIKEEMLREPVVKTITACSDPPQNIGSNSDNASWEGKSPDMDILISMSGVDFDYVETMGIEMKAGRTFSKSFSVDTPHDTLTSFLINESMERVMGMENAVGARLSFGSSGPIVGVMKDFNFQSLHNKIEPLAISIWGSDFWNYMYIRTHPGNLQASMKRLRKAWENVMPLYPFDVHFADEDFDKMYRTEERMGTLMNYFAVLAILIAGIGLYGLATFTVEQKTREMGVRKALGASSIKIFQLFTSEFFRLMLIAGVISIPTAWFLLSRFLQNYSYHTRLDIWVFLVSVLLTSMVALLAVSYQTLKAIRTNPADILKYE